MKSKKAYDRKVYAILGTILVGTLLMCANACNRGLENSVPKSGAKKLDHDKNIYEVEFDGVKRFNSRHKTK